METRNWGAQEMVEDSWRESPWRSDSLQELIVLRLIHIQRPPIHQNNHVSIPTISWLQSLLLQVSRFQLLYLSSCTCLSRYWGGSLSYDLNSLMGLRKVSDVSLSSFFLLWGGERWLLSFCTLELNQKF